jgi:polar amino acid transport system substrate-binding protein
LVATGSAVALALGGCASAATPAATGTGSSAEGSASPSAAVGVAFNQSIHDMLPADIQTAGVIQVGITVGDAPFMDKVGGAYEGIIADLAEDISTVLGVEFAYQEMPFPGLIPAIQANKIQMVWSSMFDNADREAVIDMTTYARASMGIAVVKGNPKKIEDIDDLCGASVGTTKGTVQEAALVAKQAECVKDGDPELVLSLYATQNDAYTQIQAGKLDAIMLTYTPMMYQVATIDGGNALEATPWSSPAGYMAVGAANTQDGLIEAVNAAFLQLEESGDYQKVLTAHDAEPDILTKDLLVVNGATSGVLK